MEIFGALCLFIGIVLGISSFIVILIDKSCKHGICCVILFIISLSLAIIGSIILESTKKITPLDVYRGNTELQVNYKVINNDTIVTDSIVIWKQ